MSHENNHGELYRERSISMKNELFLPFAVSAIPGLLFAAAVTCFELEHSIAIGVGGCLFVLAITAFAIGLFAKFGLGRDIIQQSLSKPETQVRDAILFVEVVVVTPIELRGCFEIALGA